MGALTWIAEHRQTFLAATRDHLALSATALAIVIGLGLPAALVLAGLPRLAAAIVGLANGLRTVPSLALLVLMLPVLGTGFAPAVVALALYGFPAVLINALAGLTGIDPDVVDAARGQGLSGRQIMARVRIPLSLPVVFTGIRTAAVQIVSAAALAAFVGGGGLGDIIAAGMGNLDFPQLVAGSLAMMALAVATELLFGALERAATRPLREVSPA